jgi:hypothetical protein
LIIPIIIASIYFATRATINIFTPLMFEAYPNLDQIESDKFSLEGFEPDSGFPQWQFVYYSEDKTYDHFDDVYDWYEKIYHYDYTFNDGSHSSVEKRIYTRIPSIGLVESYSSIHISNCSLPSNTCVKTNMSFRIIFTGLVAKLINVIP